MTSTAEAKAVAATLLASKCASTPALALSRSLPSISGMRSRKKAQPPSRVSELEPGEMWPSAKPERP